MANEVEEWWKSLPPVTKYLFAGSMILTLGANFGFLEFNTLLFDFNRIYSKFEIWRLVSPFLFQGRLGFPFLVNMLFLIQYGTVVEKEFFHNDTADYLTMILFTSLLLLIPGYLIPLPLLGLGLITVIIYYWSRRVPQDQMVRFMFGITFKAMYLPWALVAFRVLMGGMPISELCGILVGHVYYFLTEVYPDQGGRRLITTPQFLKEWFPAPGVRPARPGEGAFQAGHNWGRGNIMNQ